MTLACGSSPLRSGQALRLRSFGPIRPHVRAYHAAFGADYLQTQVTYCRFIRPSIGVDHRVVMAEPGWSSRSAVAGTRATEYVRE